MDSSNLHQTLIKQKDDERKNKQFAFIGIYPSDKMMSG